MEDILYTVPELAELLKVSTSTIHQYRKSGLMRFMKLGRWKARRVEVERFLEWSEGKDLTDPFEVRELKGDEEE